MMEYRTLAAPIVEEQWHIYASKSPTKNIWTRDLAVRAGDALPRWMIQLAEQVCVIKPDPLLPTGMMVDSAVIENVT